MDAERRLLTTPPASWRVERVIALDWYDGPRQGLCRLADPEVEFVFRLLAERTTPDDLDDRVFAVERLPAGSVASAVAALAPFGSPRNATWVPVMRHPDRNVREESKAALDAIQRRATSTPVVFYTRDFETFLGCWSADAASEGEGDWFRVIDKGEAGAKAEVAS